MATHSLSTASHRPCEPRKDLPHPQNLRRRHRTCDAFCFALLLYTCQPSQSAAILLSRHIFSHTLTNTASSTVVAYAAIAASTTTPCRGQKQTKPASHFPRSRHHNSQTLLPAVLFVQPYQGKPELHAVQRRAELLHHFLFPSSSSSSTVPHPALIAAMEVTLQNEQSGTCIGLLSPSCRFSYTPWQRP